MKLPRHEMLDNLTVYRRLILLHEELDHLSKRCWSPAAGNAHAVAAAIVRALASSLWRTGLDDSGRRHQDEDRCNNKKHGGRDS